MTIKRKGVFAGKGKTSKIRSPGYLWMPQEYPPGRPGADGSTKKATKQCPVCLTIHGHNNSYCSAECCKKAEK